MSPSLTPGYLWFCVRVRVRCVRPFRCVCRSTCAKYTCAHLRPHLISNKQLLIVSKSCVKGSRQRLRQPYLHWLLGKFIKCNEMYTAGWFHLCHATTCFVKMACKKNKQTSFSVVNIPYEQKEGKEWQFKGRCLQDPQETMFSLTLSSTQNFQRKVKQCSIILNHFWNVPIENKT